LTQTGSPLLETNEIVLKKKILSIREHYDLENRNGNKLGEADGNLFQFPVKFDVKDLNGLKLMHIEGKILSLRKQCAFHDSNGKDLGTIKKKLAKVTGEEYWVESNGVEFMRIHGDFVNHDYVMQVNGLDVATVHKKWAAVRDEIGLSITGEVDHRIVLGTLIVIEHNEVTEQIRRQSSYWQQSGYWRQNSGGGWYYR
jgi:uncharacterized protein YxjI